MGRPIWPRVGSFYGRLLVAWKTGGTTRSGAGDESNGEAELGRLLEHKRKEQGLSLEDVEQATKIRKRYLTGLERADYAMLPDAVYAQGLSEDLRQLPRPRRGSLSPAAQEQQQTAAGERDRLQHQPETDFEKPLITPSGLTGTRKRKFPTSAIVTLWSPFSSLPPFSGPSTSWDAASRHRARKRAARGEPASQRGKRSPTRKGRRVREAKQNAATGAEETRAIERISRPEQSVLPIRCRSRSTSKSDPRGS